jgi:hypothetical protein
VRWGKDCESIALANSSFRQCQEPKREEPEDSGSAWQESLHEYVKNGAFFLLLSLPKLTSYEYGLSMQFDSVMASLRKDHCAPRA